MVSLGFRGGGFEVLGSGIFVSKGVIRLSLGWGSGYGWARCAR